MLFTALPYITKMIQKILKLQIFIFFFQTLHNLLLSMTKEEGHLVIKYTNQLSTRTGNKQGL